MSYEQATADLAKATEAQRAEISRLQAENAELRQNLEEITEERDDAFGDSDHDQKAAINAEKIGREWQARATAAEQRLERIRPLVERAFRDGVAYATTVDVVDVDLAWETSKVRALSGKTGESDEG